MSTCKDETLNKLESFGIIQSEAFWYQNAIISTLGIDNFNLKTLEEILKHTDDFIQLYNEVKTKHPEPNKFIIRDTTKKYINYFKQQQQPQRRKS